MTRLERLREDLARARLCDDRALVETDDLDALLAVADAARDCGEPGWCLVEPPCGNCRACRLAAALAALDGAAED